MQRRQQRAEVVACGYSLQSAARGEAEANASMGVGDKFPCWATELRGERNRQIWPDSGQEAGAWRLSSGVGESVEAG